MSFSRSRSRVILLVEQDDDDSNNDDDGDYEDYNHEFIPANSQPTIISFTHGNVSHSNTQETTKKDKGKNDRLHNNTKQKKKEADNPLKKRKSTFVPLLYSILKHQV